MRSQHYGRILLHRAKFTKKTQKKSQEKSQWYFLPLVLLLAAVLRLYRLAAKPLWVDEIYTAFYSLGKRLETIPVRELLPPEQYWALISDPGTPWQAAQTVTTQSNHPPLFFMLMNGWLQSVGTSVWSLRAFAVLWGLVAVVGVYRLGRRVGGDLTGQIAAALMAVSPYGIYLSQEARHYSLAIAIATFALLNWVALLQGDRTLFRWLSWVGLNALGLYVHYFYGFGIIAQGLITATALIKQLQTRAWTIGQTLNQAFGWLIAIASIGVLYLPWLPSAIAHFQSEGGTSWLSHDIPLYQTVLYPLVHTLAAAVFMLVMLPVEQVPLWVAIPCALVMLGVFGAVLRQFVQGWRQEARAQAVYSDYSQEPLLQAGAPLVGYVLVVFAIMMLITYGLGKDLTRAPRYFFVLYPAVSVVLAMGLVRQRRWVLNVAIAAGILSQILISHDIALLKPFLPGQVGSRIAAEPSAVVLIAPNLDSYRALSLSYILAIPQGSTAQIALTQSASSSSWQPDIVMGSKARSETSILWLIEPKRGIPFPTEVRLPTQSCLSTGEQISTEGTRQQKYQCHTALEPGTGP
ncbi:MAG: glycosyltransferase family 39 protein [Cyanobacteria bacterium P01_D01_bin.1]